MDVRLAVFLSALVGLSALEALLPFRPAERGRRWPVNLALGALNGLVVFPALGLLRQWFGVPALGLRSLPAAIGWPVTFLALDLQLWLWHVANHRLAFLWRFHRLHHTDTVLDVTSASRFHPAEVVTGRVVSVLFGGALGADPVAQACFEALVTAASQLQHLNVLVPRRIERLWETCGVSPLLHSLHHEAAASPCANYGTVLSLWDRVFGTFRIGDREAVRIGA